MIDHIHQKIPINLKQIRKRKQLTQTHGNTQPPRKAKKDDACTKNIHSVEFSQL